MRLKLLFLLIAFATTSISVAQDLHFKDKALPCLDKKISIVVHLVKDQAGLTNITEAQLNTELQAANQMFSPICLSFDFCEIREIDNFQYNTVDSMGVWEEMQVTYNVPGKINVYYVESFQFVQDICGFGTHNGIFLEDNTGGIIIQKSCAVTGIQNFAHQLGHFFGLQNTFLGNELVARVDCETTGDSLCDTPADNYTLVDNPLLYVDFLTDTCRFTNTVLDNDGQYYCPDVGNIMSNYTLIDPVLPFIECRCGFTADQYRLIARNCLSAKKGG